MVISLLLFFFAILLFTYSTEVTESISFSLSLWIHNLIPSLFPFFFLSEFMIAYDFVSIVSNCFKGLMEKFFHLPGSASFPFVMSMISGFPSGAKYVRSMVDTGLLTEEDATHLLTFTHFSNPLFILGFVNILLGEKKRVALIILFCHYSVNLLLGRIMRKRKPRKESINLPLPSLTIEPKKPFGTIFKNAIFHSFETLVLMLGCITFFLMMSTILSELIPLSSLQNAILSGFLEMTQGIKKITDLSLSTPLQASFITFFLSFGGLSIHMQVASIISDTKIKYRPYLIARILHGTISSILSYFFTSLI